MSDPQFQAAPKVFIVILNWNGLEDTLACLESLEHLDYPNFEVVVVDNDSSDGSEEVLKGRYPQHVIIQSGANLGFAGGTNVGLRYALGHDASYAWLLNNDTLVEPDALTELVKRMQEKPGAGLCGSTLVYHFDRSKIQAYGGATYNKWLSTSRHIGQDAPRYQAGGEVIDAEEVEAQLDYLVGASCLASRAFLEEVGLMSEDYFLYFEELDWAARAKGRYALAFAPKSVVYHKEGGSIGSSSDGAKKSRLADYYGVRNRLLYTRLHAPEALPSVYLGLLITLAKRVQRRQWGRIPMILKLALTQPKVRT